MLMWQREFLLKEHTAKGGGGGILNMVFRRSVLILNLKVL